MTNNILEGITILDFGHRLPGPLAGKILAGLGARVIKVEDHIFQDPFCAGAFAEFDASFKDWYKELNGKKEILRLDFKSPTIKEEIRLLLQKSSGIINGLPEKVQKSLGIDSESILKLERPIAVVDMKASKESKTAMHDLNALAMTGLLSLYVEGKTKNIVDPPFLPIAGINFGHKVATDLLAVLLKVRESGKSIFHTTYLLESTEEIFNAFWPRSSRHLRTKFLHNGLYPCYSLYKTADDKYVALAAVEEKFWIEFCEVFELNIPKEERFNHQDDKVFRAISKCFLSLTQKEIKKITERHDFCLSLI
ncbi:CoA transferase [Halobacteriovorax sp. JY17]|uniref:CoA transferase n=1 Tax=Halobacteriovorax sp. JY17 TaxID=2014617 RepID=UPI000C4430FF|nr:CoA transferase [Halobacteriovorax sp. JY17]PIK15859.1 MAG: hypothetical protein CES88_03800 [Halobacteriovorax sp. JY17]